MFIKIIIFKCTLDEWVVCVNIDRVSTIHLIYLFFNYYLLYPMIVLSSRARLEEKKKRNHRERN